MKERTVDCCARFGHANSSKRAKTGGLCTLDEICPTQNVAVVVEAPAGTPETDLNALAAVGVEPQQI